MTSEKEVKQFIGWFVGALQMISLVNNIQMNFHGALKKKVYWPLIASVIWIEQKLMKKKVKKARNN